MHFAVDAHGVPVRIFITKVTVADCAQAEKLTEGIKAGALLADLGYDSDAIAERADEALYKLRHFVENAFVELKYWC